MYILCVYVLQYMYILKKGVKNLEQTKEQWMKVLEGEKGKLCNYINIFSKLYFLFIKWFIFFLFLCQSTIVGIENIL